MKTLIGIRRQLNIKKLKQKFEKLHQTTNDSAVKVYVRKEKGLVNQDTITTDVTLTSNTDSSCEIIFPSIFYDFITNVLPDEPIQLEAKLSIINFIVSESPELKYIYERDGYLVFSNNLFNRAYDDYLTAYLLKALDGYEATDFSAEEEFVIIAKDSLGDEYARTNSFSRSEIIQNSSFTIICPISDSTTTVKDGFNIYDVPYFFYKNTQRDVEIEINVIADDLRIQNLEPIIVKEITIDTREIKQYNELYYELVYGNIK